MHSWNLGLVSAAICLLVMMTDAEPSCENVQDFGQCSGNTINYCPEGIECSCKDGHPFCSCPYYKGPKSDYWYMGARCDQLWSTQDLIIVTVVPAVTLGVIVAVIAQLIHCCKTKSHRKIMEQPRRQKERLTTNTHRNEAYQSNTRLYVENSPIKTQAPRKMERTAQNFEIPDHTQVHVNRNVAGPQPRISTAPPNHTSNSPYFPPNAHFGNPLPKEDYNIGELDDYHEIQHPKLVPKYAVPVLPRFGHSIDESNSSSIAPRSDRPYVIGRPQIKNVNGY